MYKRDRPGKRFSHGHYDRADRDMKRREYGGTELLPARKFRLAVNAALTSIGLDWDTGHFVLMSCMDYAIPYANCMDRIADQIAALAVRKAES